MESLNLTSSSSRPNISLSRLLQQNIKNNIKRYPCNSKSPFLLQSPQTRSFRSNSNAGFNQRFIISCKFRTSKDEISSRKKDKKSVGTTKIVLPEANGAPVLSEDGTTGKSNDVSVNQQKPPPPPRKNSNTGFGFYKSLWRRALSILSNLPLALAEMFTVAALMALGTVIDQGEAPEFYFQKYPEDNPALGFFTWRWVLTLGFDHMFSSPVFLGSLALLGASLMACTYTTQIPLVKVARRSDFVNSLIENLRKHLSFYLLYIWA